MKMSKQVRSQFLSWYLEDEHAQSSDIAPWWKVTRPLSLQIVLQGSIHSQQQSRLHVLR